MEGKSLGKLLADRIDPFTSMLKHVCDLFAGL